MRPKLKEVNVAAPAVTYLEEMGLDVYQEVSIRNVVADVVAVKNGREIWIGEAKTSWSLDLLEQLREHMKHGRAHRVFAIVPHAGEFASRVKLCKDLGIGVIAVEIKRDGSPDVAAMIHLGRRVTPKPLPKVLAILDEGHKTHAQAGTACAKGRWTPFRKTCEALRQVVRNNPGIALKDAIIKSGHHYSSDVGARTCLADLIKQDVIEGVESRLENRKLKLYPKKLGE
jgi:hypothetical protein